jgi:hypothetical protein
MQPVGCKFYMHVVFYNNNDWCFTLLLCNDIKCMQFYCDMLCLCAEYWKCSEYKIEEEEALKKTHKLKHFFRWVTLIRMMITITIIMCMIIIVSSNSKITRAEHTNSEYQWWYLKVQTFVSNCCTAIIKHHSKQIYLRTTPHLINSN